jgi:hypothetical protein
MAPSRDGPMPVGTMIEPKVSGSNRRSNTMVGGHPSTPFIPPYQRDPGNRGRKKSCTKCETFMIGNSTLSFCFCSNSILWNSFHAHSDYRKDGAQRAASF